MGSCGSKSVVRWLSLIFRVLGKSKHFSSVHVQRFNNSKKLKFALQPALTNTMLVAAVLVYTTFSD